MLSVKGLTWGTPEFIRIAEIGEKIYEIEDEEEDDEK